MVFIDKESYPAKGIGQKILAVIMALIILFMSINIVLNNNTLRYESNNLLECKTSTNNTDFYGTILNIIEDKKQNSDLEIEGWSFDKDEFKNTITKQTVAKDNKNNDLKQELKKCLKFKYIQYELKIKKDNTTFNFKSEEDALAYKKKINTNVEISKVVVDDVNITDEKTLNKKYNDLRKSVVVASAAKSISSSQTSRGGNVRESNASHMGILPLRSYHSISSHYRPSNRPSHTGVDYAAPYGTDILAFQTGTIVFVGWNGGYGMSIEVNHGNGMITRYAHMSSYSVGVGDYVSQGQVLGGVGSTGNSTGNHLHFEVIISGEYYNPLGYIQ